MTARKWAGSIQAGFSKLRCRLQYDVFAMILPPHSFMNLGFAGGPAVTLDGVDADERHALQLYNHITRRIELRDRTVLEVGCGRGGGCCFLARHREARQVVGVDLSPGNVAAARRGCRDPAVRFLCGDAESLHFPDQFFDVVINLESSHFYPHVERFFEQVARVLRPDGVFVYADTFQEERLARVERALARIGFTVELRENITANVVRSIEECTDQHRRRIEAWKHRLHVPGFLLNHLLVTTDSPYYEILSSQWLRYMNFVLRRGSPA